MKDLYNCQVNPSNSITIITTQENRKLGDALLLHEIRKTIHALKTEKNSRHRQHLTRALNVLRTRNKEITDNYLPQDMEYKTVTERLDPHLFQIKNIQNVQESRIN